MLASVIFASMLDRHGLSILSIRDQNTASSIRRRRLMTLAQLFLIHRYRAGSLHYLTPTEDNQAQTQRMQDARHLHGREDGGRSDHRRGRRPGARRPNWSSRTAEQLAELIRKPVPQLA